MAADSVADYFNNTVPARLEKDPEGSKAIGAVYQFCITGDGGGNWVMDFTKPEVREGEDADAQCTMTVSDEDFLGIINGTINPMQAFMMGKIKIGGNMALAMKLQQVLGG